MNPLKARPLKCPELKEGSSNSRLRVRNIKYNHISRYNKFQKQERIQKATSCLKQKVLKIVQNATEVEIKDSKSFLKF